MNKKKAKILVVVLTLLLVMVVGYALFSDTLTINGTATANGNVELTTTAVDLNEEWAESFLNYGAVSKGIVNNPSISVSGNEVTTSVELGMPGSFYNFGFKIKNTGSIPVKLKSIIDKTNNLSIVDDSLDEFELRDGVYMLYQDENDKRKNFMFAQLATDSGYYDDYAYDITERWFEEQNFNTEMLKAILDPGEEVYYFIHYHWGLASTTPGEPLTLNWQIEINWEQVTAQ